MLSLRPLSLAAADRSVQAARDRFVLSNGHACALLYSMLHLTGYDLSMDELKKFRTVGSRCVRGCGCGCAGCGPGLCCGPLWDCAVRRRNMPATSTSGSRRHDVGRAADTLLAASPQLTPAAPVSAPFCSTAGHPENILHPAIEVSTGPLGQGISNAVGMAIAEANLAATYNKAGSRAVVDNYTYVICGDGCLQEGISSEASSLAGHLGLGKLIVCYDDNHVTIDGDTDLSFSEDVLKRYEAYGWHVQHVADGNHDLAGIEAAIRAAQAVHDRPSIIKVTTTIGFGSAKQGTEAVHGSALGKDDLKHVKAGFGFDPEATFVVPDEVYAHYRAAVPRGAAAEAEWSAAMEAYAAAHPAEAAELKRREAGALPEGWMDKLPRYKPTDKADATRCVCWRPRGAAAAASRACSGGLLLS
jgi:transketolase